MYAPVVSRFHTYGVEVGPAAAPTWPRSWRFRPGPNGGPRRLRSPGSCPMTSRLADRAAGLICRAFSKLPSRHLAVQNLMSGRLAKVGVNPILLPRNWARRVPLPSLAVRRGSRSRGSNGTEFCRRGSPCELLPLCLLCRCLALAPAVPAAAQEAPAGVKGLFLLTDYPAVTVRPGTASTVNLRLQNYALPPERLTLAVSGRAVGLDRDAARRRPAGGGRDAGQQPERLVAASP